MRGEKSELLGLYAPAGSRLTTKKRSVRAAMCCMRSIDCWQPCSCAARCPAPAVHVRNAASAAASDVSRSEGGKLSAVMQLPAWKV